MKFPPAMLTPLFCFAMLTAASVAGTPAENLLRRSDDWMRTDEGRTRLDNILSWQTRHGDWPKNTDTTQRRPPGTQIPPGTFDNGATTGEIRVLARGFQATGEARYREAVQKSVDHILAAQYPHGGWPQFYPLSNGYHRHVTFNDGTMIQLLRLLSLIVSDPDFQFLDSNRRRAATQAIERGHQCILRCQIMINDRPTVWCAQHHAKTLRPVQARPYEHPSLSGAESAGILRYLMKLERPSPEVIRAVRAGVAWFESAKIEGYRYRRGAAEPALRQDRDAAALWARFYEIETMRPIFSDRDGVVRYDIQQIGSERRAGYTWYGTWGADVLTEYARWPHR